MLTRLRTSYALINRGSIPSKITYPSQSISRCYSSEHDNQLTEIHHEQKQIDNTEDIHHFWEVDDRKKVENKRETKYKVDSDDFRQLLNDLFSKRDRVNDDKISKRPVGRTESMIEKKLLEMVVNNKQPYRSKAPLPSNMLRTLQGRIQPRKKAMENMYDPFRRMDNLRSQRKPNDKDYISLKEKELDVMNKITSSKSGRQLLMTIDNEINQSQYPLYYPRILSKAIEQSSYHDPYLAITIFEQAKSKSIDSFIHGCTTDVYNTLLSIRWNIWRDLYGVLKLVEEMSLYGIESNDVTQHTLFGIIKTIEEEGAMAEGTESIFWDQEERKMANLIKSTRKWKFMSR